MKTSNGHSTFKNTPPSSAPRSFYKKRLAESAKQAPSYAAAAVAESFKPEQANCFFKMFGAFRSPVLPSNPGQCFRLVLSTEKPDFTPADQEWIARMATQPVSWQDW